ncbi:MAG: tyrosine-type recombinase/integrase, partial [Syntrophomonadaceae bacterium]
GRYIPISPFLETELKKQKDKQAEWAKVYGEGFNPLNLVVCWQDGRPIDPNEVTKKYNRVLEKLNLPKETRFHDLRHAHATMLFEDGAEAKDVSEELGHSSIVITNDIYINPNIDRRRDLVNKLDKKFVTEKEKPKGKKYKVKRLSKP